MNRSIKRIFRVVAPGLLALLGLTLAILAVLALDKPLTRRILVRYLERRTDFILSVRKLDYSVFPLNVEVSGLKASREIEGQKIGLAVGHLEARGAWKRLFRKDQAFFDSIRMNDVGLEILVLKTGHQKGSWRSLPEVLNRLGPIEVNAMTLRMSFPSMKVEALDGGMAINRGDGPAEYRYRLRAEKADLETPKGTTSFTGSLVSSGKFELGERPALEGEMVVDSLRLARPELSLSLPEPIKISTRCEYDETENALRFSELEIEAPPLFRASGPVDLRLGEKFSAQGNSVLTLSAIAPALERLRPIFPARLGELDATGEAVIRGDWLYTSFPAPKLDLKLGLAFDNAALSFSGPELSAYAAFSGDFAVDGAVPGFQISGRLKFGNGRLRTKNLAVNNITAELQVERQASSITVSGFKGSGINLVSSLGGEKWALNNLAVEGRGRLDTEKMRAALTSMKFQSLELPLILAEARVGLKPRADKFFRLESPDANIQEVADYFRPVLPVQFSAWQPKGNFGFEGEFEEIWTPERSWKCRGRLSFRDLKLENPAFGLAGEGLTPNLDFSVAYSHSGRQLSFNLSLLLDHGEVLWREFYHDWSAGSLRTIIKGMLDPPDRRVLIQEAGLAVEPFGRLHASGALSGRGPLSFNLQVSTALADPAAVLSLVSSRPGSGAGSLTFGGDWSADIRLKKAVGLFSAVGAVTVRNGRVEESQSPVLVSGLNARLPFCIVMGSADAGSEIHDVFESGFISAEEIRTPFLAIAPFTAAVEGSPNSWLIEPISFEAWGGRAAIGQSRFTFDPGTGQFHGQSSLSLSDGIIQRLLPSSDRFNLAGSLNLSLPSVDITTQKIATEGEATANLFSGQVVARRLRVERPFSQGRVIAADIAFSGLDLEKMTDALPFGRVTGIVEGVINNLAFSYGQPEHFDLRLESVKKKGVKQTFSLKAVDDLTILSQGAGPVPSQAFFLRFVPAFPYEKIGIRCSLRNDVFTLRGLIREKDVEYLVRRAWPFGINIINRDPNRQISFKDMVGRLKRISSSEGRKGST